MSQKKKSPAKRFQDPPAQLEQRILSISDEHLDAIDASIAAKRNDPNFQPRKVEWLDDGPDPFGMDWKWADPPQEDELQ